ncbi:MAG: TolC family protein [Leptolyngbyaceae cyanobacterium bins.59]|nr:TolC family protein [Leptolyngbyaceae cyanobacterium bins.59]
MINPFMPHDRAFRGWRVGMGATAILTFASITTTALPPTIAQVSPLVPVIPGPQRILELSLEEAISLLLQNNRELKNASLERLVQRQQLREAESTFDWQVQPLFGIGVSRLLSQPSVGTLPNSIGLGSLTVPGFGSSASGGTVLLPPETTYTRSTQVVGRLRSSLGTTLTLSLDPFRQDPALVTVTQPLLRGAGTAVNEAPVQVARLSESRGRLELRRTLIDRITNTATAYRALIRAQEALRIQEISIANQRRLLELFQVLVDAGRRARVELVDIQANLATQEAQKIVLQNQLAQAQSELLKTLELPETVQLVIPEREIAAFRQTDSNTLQRVRQLNLETLVQTAYQNRPDYLQTDNEIRTAKLTLLIARNNQEWGLDLQGNASTGPISQMSAALVLSRVFDDQGLETASQRSRISLQQRQNDRARLTETIRLEVGDRLRDVNSAIVRISATELARQLAEQRAANAQEQSQRGRGRDIFELLQLQNQVITAQQEELNARIDLFNALTTLDQALGITLEAWQNQVNASQLLQEPGP